MARNSAAPLTRTIDLAAEGAPGIPRIVRPLSLAEVAHRSIRKAIRDGVFEAGKTYSESTIAEALGMSRTPVREALIEFQKDGLIEIQPQRGFRLRALTAADREEIFLLRTAIERVVIRALAQRRTTDDVVVLRQILDRQRAAADDPARFIDLDEEFHLTMTRMVAMERAFHFLLSLRGVLWLLGTEALQVPHRTEKILAEHRAIIDAIDAGDPRAAEKAMSAHIEETEAAIERATSG